jgi:hypothetical protein
MNKKIKAAALAAGAKTDMDFSLFSSIVYMCKQIRTLQMPNVSAACESPESAFLLYDYYLTHGRFYEPQPLPKRLSP